MLSSNGAGKVLLYECIHCQENLQVWHIQALVLGKFSWCEHSIAFLPSLYLSSVDLTLPGLSPTQTNQQETSGWKRIDKNERILVKYKSGQMTVKIRSSESCDSKQLQDLTGHKDPTDLPKPNSPPPQLCAASLHRFWKAWHQLASSKKWRVKRITSFSSPKKF